MSKNDSSKGVKKSSPFNSSVLKHSMGCGSSELAWALSLLLMLQGTVHWARWFCTDPKKT
jgi:hypothetical protein